MEKKRIKILSYNIHKGFNTGNRGFILKNIRDALEQVQPDIIFLQEVLGHHKAYPEPQFKFLAGKNWHHYSYGKNAVYSHGHHGNAILSKFPIRFSENIDVSTNKVEKRGLLHAIVTVPQSKNPLHLICVHLGLLESERKTQVKRLLDRIDSHVPHDQPLVIGGDFNDWREKVSPQLKSKLDLQEAFEVANGSHARTFPSWLPALKLDRLYFRGSVLRLAKCMSGEPWSKMSDHLALYTELAIAEG